VDAKGVGLNGVFLLAEPFVVQTDDDRSLFEDLFAMRERGVQIMDGSMRVFAVNQSQLIILQAVVSFGKYFGEYPEADGFCCAGQLGWVGSDDAFETGLFIQ